MGGLEMTYELFCNLVSPTVLEQIQELLEQPSEYTYTAPVLLSLPSREGCKTFVITARKQGTDVRTEHLIEVPGII